MPQPIVQPGTSGSAAPATHWVVVNTHPHREAAALENLRQQDFDGYCPMLRRKVRHARQTRLVLRPLFPGYLFVSLDPLAQRWRPLLSTIGVRTLVRFGATPGVLDPAFIASLKALESDGAIELPVRQFEIGQTVRFRDGPFEGLVATIVAMDERDRLTVLLELLRGSVRVHVDAGSLDAG